MTNDLTNTIALLIVLFVFFLFGSLSAWFCYVIHIRPSLLRLWNNLRELVRLSE